MFSWRKKSTPRPAYPPALPPPILRTPSDNSDRPTSPSRIRFTASGGRPASPPRIREGPPPPRLVVSYHDSQPQQTQPSPGRRSSRPPSPSSTSFGSRTSPAVQHVTTPPTVYVSSMQQRAPPPPSPYRPTTEQRERTGLPARRISELAPMASRPVRHSSLFVGTSSVPQLNIIPATPQDSAEGFSPILVEPTESVSDTTSPTLDVELEFTPFAPLAALPSSESTLTIRPPSPLDSHASLPSLSSSDSHSSLGQTMSSSSSASSLISFPDVEAALGSMLASLEPDMPEENNPGLGLGLDLPEPPSITAPLSKLRKAPPPPLDLRSDERVNHRVAFYKTAKAAPNTPTSGVFIDAQSPLSSLGSMTSLASSNPSWHSLDEIHHGLGLGLGLDGVFESSFARRRSVSEPHAGCRDSMSVASEASDEDLHTASIISLAPMPGFGEARLVEKEEMLAVAAEVGLAL